MVQEPHVRLSRITRCRHCRRQVAWKDEYGWCVGCKRQDLEPDELRFFDWIRGRDRVLELAVPPAIMEILLQEELVEVEDGWVREKRH